MSKHDYRPPLAPTPPVGVHYPRGFAESDEAFLERQFQQCAEALERVGALAPGEFDLLARTPANTEEERQQRTARHYRIAQRALKAAQQGQLREEDFNIWSGRRKEGGQPVKIRFEQAYTRYCTPSLSCMRGALTGIVRTYLRLQDEMIDDFITDADNARTAEQLLAVERQAIKVGLLEFGAFTSEPLAGWPTFPRSTGRFRGAARLREHFERRQHELPMSPRQTAALVNEVARLEQADADTDEGLPVLRESEPRYWTRLRHSSPFFRAIASVTRLFR